MELAGSKAETKSKVGLGNQAKKSSFLKIYGP